MNLIIGNGLIGRHLYYLLRPDAIMTSREELDLCRDDWVLPKCSTAFICAGITSTEYCGSHREESQLVNITNTVKLAERLKRTAHVVWLSSERVFDGSVPFRKVTDEVCPTTEYGRQKAVVEELLLNLGATVIRFSKVLGWHVPLFEQWFKSLEANEVIHPYSNMAMSPLPVSFAVSFIEKVAKLKGLYQVSALEDLSYEQIARYIAAWTNKALVQPVEASSGHPNSTLDDDGICKKLGINIPYAWDTIYRRCNEIGCDR